MSASTPSSAATFTTSSTVAFIARWSRIAASLPCCRAYRSRPAMPLYSQPPLRPEAPKPQNRCSSTVIRRYGAAFFR